MEDFEMKLGGKESAKIYSRLRDKPSTYVGCFLWAKTKDVFPVSIEIYGEEKLQPHIVGFECKHITN